MLVILSDMSMPTLLAMPGKKRPTFYVAGRSFGKRIKATRKEATQWYPEGKTRRTRLKLYLDSECADDNRQRWLHAKVSCSKLFKNHHRTPHIHAYFCDTICICFMHWPPGALVKGPVIMSSLFQMLPTISSIIVGCK